jgi:hypothetical protein
VIHHPFPDSYLMIRIHSQASGSVYDPSFVTETLKEIESSDAPSQDIQLKLLKDAAVQTYTG